MFHEICHSQLIWHFQCGKMYTRGTWCHDWCGTMYRVCTSSRLGINVVVVCNFTQFAFLREKFNDCQCLFHMECSFSVVGLLRIC
jgi:hypothetical protein